MATRQSRRPTLRGQKGIAVDASGGPVVDPTENVLSLVDVEKEHAKELRISDQRFNDAMRRADNDHRKEVADLKQGYDKQISDILTVQVKTTSELISTQLDKVTTSLSNQIKDAASVSSGLMNTLSERIGRLEQAQWQTAGKTSVSDPATSDALNKMAAAVQSLTTGKDKSEGQGIGRSEVIGWIVAAAVVVGLIVRFFGH